MGAITRKYDVKVDCIVTESYIYAPVDLSSCKIESSPTSGAA